MDANRRRVLERAEQGDWDDVLELVAHDPALAQAQDDFGMLPLHWACTEPSVALETIKVLLAAFPEACQLENLSGMAPLHVAIASKMTGLAINALLQTYPEAAFMKDGSGRYPIELAMDNNLPKFTIDLIRKAGARAVRSSSAAVLARSASSDSLAELDTGSSLRRWSSDNGGTGSSSSDDDSSVHGAAELLKARSIGSLMASRQASEYARLLDEKLPAASCAAPGSSSSSCSSSVSAPIGPIESTEISLHLKELLAQLQQLSVDIRSSSSASGSTYRSSLSSSSSGSRHRDGGSSESQRAGNTVLWNPSDKLGFVMEPATPSDTGARIKKFASRSSVLGVESLSVGDVLASINGTSVVRSSFASITRFLKHAKVTCKLCFVKGDDGSSGRGATASQALAGYVRSDSSSSTYSTKSGASLHRIRNSNSITQQQPQQQNLQLLQDPTADQDTAMLYAKVAELLDTTLKKVAAVEETVRLSSAMSFCA